MVTSPLRVRRFPHSSTPTIVVEWQGEVLGSLTLALDDGVAHLTSRLQGPSLAWWSISSRRWDDRDAFARLLGLVNRGPGDAAEAFALRKELVTFGHEVRSLIPTTDLRLASHFWPQARLGVLALLRRPDEVIWRQLLHVSPGAALAALRLKALADAGQPSEWPKVELAVHQGARLSVVLDLLTRSLHPDEDRNEHFRRRRLLRWLPAACNPSLLTRGMPAVFTPEDLRRVGRGETDAEDWYTTMLPANELHGDAQSPIDVRSVSAYCARHAEALGDPALATLMLNYSRATGRLPSRGTPLGRWLKAISHWEAAEDAKNIGGPALDAAAPMPNHLRAATGDMWAITPLRTWGAALDDCRRQRLRDACGLGEARDLGKSLYSVRVRGRVLTLEVACVNDRLFVTDFFGAAKRRPSSEERRIVERWIADENPRP